MPTVTPDAEEVVAAFLQGESDVRALVDDRVGTKTPGRTKDAWVKLTQIDDVPYARSRALHLTTAHIQFDCYGGDDRDLAEAEASDLVRTVRAALHEMPEAVHDGAVVSSVTFGPMSRVPDPDFTPARERFILDAYVVLHPEAD